MSRPPLEVADLIRAAGEAFIESYPLRMLSLYFTTPSVMRPSPNDFAIKRELAECHQRHFYSHGL
jgi:hypothetical protein